MIQVPIFLAMFLELSRLRWYNKMIGRGGGVVLIDPQDVYWCVLMHPNHRIFLQFWRTPARVTPFQPLWSPGVVYKLLKPIVAAFVRYLGVRLLIYLDDLLLLNQSQTALEKDKCLLLVLLHKLGFVVNQQKSMLISTQKIEYLGFVINSGLLASHRRRLTIDGLAAVCNGTTTHRLWSPSENLDHINILILKAASFGNGICQVLISNTYSSPIGQSGNCCSVKQGYINCSKITNIFWDLCLSQQIIITTVKGASGVETQG